MAVIELHGLTKDYGRGRGVFDLTFGVEKGEVFGFLGPNGAGKTTAIRQLMGFIRPDAGSCSIGGLDCGRQTADIQRSLGYLPGEIALMDEMTGTDFLSFIAEIKGVRDLSRAKALLNRFELDASGSIRRMSKGMKQKLGIVCAFMADPAVLILDEPTSGLDPLMQHVFIELILEEKARGKTILLSSHMFEEVERTCDRVGILKAGHLVAIETVTALKESRRRVYTVTLTTAEAAAAFAAEPALTLDAVQGRSVTVAIQGEIAPLIAAMARHPVTNLETAAQRLEDIFLEFYGGDHI